MKKYIVLTLLFSSAFTLILTGCFKKKDTLARITVYDAENRIVSGAQVVLFSQSTTDPIQEAVLGDTSTTNSSGIATFNFNDVYQSGQAGVAVLNIRATKNGLVGNGIIQIKEEEDNTASVFIQAN